MRIVIVRTVLVWLIVWPLVTGMLILLNLLTSDLTLPLQTLVLTAILIPLISLWLAPKMQRFTTHLMKGKL